MAKPSFFRLPSFSLKWLLVAVALLGLGLAAMSSESQPLAELFQATIWLALTTSVVIAVIAQGILRNQARGFVIFAASYLAFATWSSTPVARGPAALVERLARPAYELTIPRRAAEKAAEAGGVATPFPEAPDRGLFQLGPPGLTWFAWAESWQSFLRCASGFAALIAGFIGARIAGALTSRSQELPPSQAGLHK